jgi:hypothetical protein
MVIGNSAAWGGDLVVGHSVMGDAIDRDAVRDAIVNAGIEFDWSLAPTVKWSGPSSGPGGT